MICFVACGRIIVGVCLQRFYRERLRAEKRALRELEWLHGEEEEEAAEKEKA